MSDLLDKEQGLPSNTRLSDPLLRVDFFHRKVFGLTLHLCFCFTATGERDLCSWSFQFRALCIWPMWWQLRFRCWTCELEKWFSTLNGEEWPSPFMCWWMVWHTFASWTCPDGRRVSFLGVWIFYFLEIQRNVYICL